mmetsp:Transcript_3636/g.6661  ORF Transcript_3636/g.6661 Transcript_3636/m.6661 type:complete len:193 (+) Transcript_3636:52-630(+)
MKISLYCYFFFFFAPLNVKAQNAEPGCSNWTKAVIDANPNLETAEDEYVNNVAGIISSNCLTSDGELAGCTVNLGQSDKGDKYWEECTKDGKGAVWTYRFSPLCSEGGGGDATGPDFMKIGGIWVCAAANCTRSGVGNLVPDRRLLEPFAAQNYSCGTSLASNELVPAAGASLKTSVVFLTMAVISAVSSWM